MLSHYEEIKSKFYFTCHLIKICYKGLYALHWKQIPNLRSTTLEVCLPPLKYLSIAISSLHKCDPLF